MASPAWKRWLRPEVYPLFAAVGAAVGICAMQLVRNITTNPEVRNRRNWADRSICHHVKIKSTRTLMDYLVNRVTKQNRAAGILDNYAEGEKYAEHGVRKFVRNKRPEIMPSVNGFFTNPK